MWVDHTDFRQLDNTVQQDYVQAHMWRNVAASRQTGEDRKISADARDALAGLMTPDQLAEAQRLARDWVPGSVPGAAGDVRPAGTGTAFIVHPDGLLLTAHHVIEQATSITVSCNGQPAVPAAVTSSHATIDLAVLETSSDLGTASFLRLATQDVPSLGDSVFTMGYPTPGLLGTEAKFNEGTVSGLSGPGGDASFLQISVPIQPGNSGGPLVNAEGDVVGVVVATANVPTFIQATDTIPQNINWAVKSAFASVLFEPPPADVTSPTERADIIERVQEATCLVRVTGPAQ